MKKILLSTVLLSALVQAQASTIQFDLLGKAGAGLLAGNENGTVNGTPGSGGEVGAGILFDDVLNQLTLNIGWGVANGFANLTGTTTGGHLHAPTASGGVAAFTQNAGVRIPLDGLAGWNTSASSGGFSGTVAIAPGDVAALLNGQFYLNVHTSMNGGGEIRGNLVAVPEPSSLLLVAAGAGVLLMGRRFRRNS